MTDLDRNVERLNELDDIVAYVRRPAGIAILVGLFVLAGTAHILAALGAFLAVGNDTTLFEAFPWLTSWFPNVWPMGDLATFWTVAGIVLVVIGVLDLVVAWALWDLRSWAWGAALALSIVELFIVPMGVFVSVLRIVYLSFRDVRAAYDEEYANYRATISARRIRG